MASSRQERLPARGSAVLLRGTQIQQLLAKKQFLR